MTTKSCEVVSSPGPTTDDGKTALHLAAENGWCLAVRLILERTHDARARDGFGRTALHLAAAKGHVDVVTELLTSLERHETGLRINARDNKGRTALHVAAENGKEKVIEVLLSSEEVNIEARIS